MRPREFFQKHTSLAEDDKLIFVLLPAVLEDRYLQHIKKPILSIKDRGEIKCRSYLENIKEHAGRNAIEVIWEEIHRAEIVIADITGLSPSVMLELGVALLRKEKVIIIAEESTSQTKLLPFNIANLNVWFYKAETLDSLSDSILDYIRKNIEYRDPLPIPEVLKILKEARDLRNEGRLAPADLLCKEANALMKHHWYVLKEWGITIAAIPSRSREAEEKLKMALDLAQSFENKAEILIELGKLYMEMEDKGASNHAFAAFEQAYGYSEESADLFKYWAALYASTGQYEKAFEKQRNAYRLDDSDENRLLQDYYDERSMGHTKLSYPDWVRRLKPPSSPSASSPSRGGRPGPNPLLYKQFKAKNPVGKIVKAKVSNANTRIGVFVIFENGAVGLAHMNQNSQLKGDFDGEDKYAKGAFVTVQVIGYDDEKSFIHLKLSENQS